MHSEILRFALLLSLPGLLLPSPAAAQRWNDIEDALEGRELILRPTFEGRRKVYLDMEDDRLFALHRGDRLFPLREGETVRITDADPEDDHIELELQSARLGRGRVDFYGPPPSAEDFELWLDEVFEVTTAEADFHRYIGNRRSQTLHIRGANHLPDMADQQPFATESDALTGVRPLRCLFCPYARCLGLPDRAFTRDDVTSAGTVDVLSTRRYRVARAARRCRAAGPRPVAGSAQGLPVPIPGRRLRRHLMRSRCRQGTSS